MRKKVSKILAFVLSLVMLCTSVDLSAFAYLTDKDGYLSVDTDDGSLTEDSSWEEKFPTGTFAFKNDAVNITEDDKEEQKITIYRLGGTKGKATAYVAVTPLVEQLDEEGKEYIYANGACNTDINVKAEDSVSQEETAGLEQLDMTYEINTHEKNDQVTLSLKDVEGQYIRYFWHVYKDGKWSLIDNKEDKELTISKEEYADNNYICVVESDYELSLSDSLKDIEEASLYVNKNSRTIQIPAVSEGLSYSEIPLDTNNPYKTSFFEVDFEENEWVKDIVVSANDDLENESVEISNFTIYDAEGAEFTEAANRCALTVYDDEPVIPSKMGIGIKEVRVDKSEGTATIRVKRTEGLQYVSSVDFETADATAKAGTDYAATKGIASFSGGFDYYDIQIPLINDKKKSDKDVSFVIKLTNPKSGTINKGEDIVIVTLYNSDTAKEDNVATLITDGQAIDLSGTNETDDKAVTENTDEADIVADATPQRGQLEYTPSVGNEILDEQSISVNYDWSKISNTSGWTNTYNLMNQSWSYAGTINKKLESSTSRGYETTRYGSMYMQIPQLFNNFSSFSCSGDIDTEKTLYWAYNYLSAVYGYVGKLYTEPTGSHTKDTGDDNMDNYLSDRRALSERWLISFRGSQAESGGSGGFSAISDFNGLTSNKTNNYIVFSSTITRSDGGTERGRTANLELTSAYLTRRILENNPQVIIYTPDDDTISSSQVGNIKPQISLQSGGKDANNHIYLGSVFKLIPNAASTAYSINNANLKVNNSTVSTLSNSNLALYKSNEEVLPTKGNYTINTYLDRNQTYTINYGSSILPDDTQADITAKKNKIISNITYKYKTMQDSGYVYSNAPAKMTGLVDNEAGNKYISGNVKNLKSINFGLTDGSVIIYNNKKYSGDADITISSSDYTNTNVSFTVITPDAVSVEKDPKVASIDTMFVYSDTNNNHKYDNADKIITALSEENVCLDQFKGDNMYVYVKYTVSNSCLEVPDGKDSNAVFSMYSSFVNVATSEQEKLNLTKEQKAYRDILHYNYLNGTKNTEPYMYGTNLLYEMSVPVGKDASPADPDKISDANYKWNPSWQGNLINKFSSTSPIKLDGTWMPDGYTVAATDAQVNGYLGCLQRNDTVVLTVRPNSIVNSTQMFNWQTYPEPGRQTFSQSGETSCGTPEGKPASDSSTSIADTDPAVNLPAIEVGLGPLTYMMGEDEIGFSIGIPIYSKEGNEEGKFTKDIAQDNLDEIKKAFSKTGNVFKKLRQRADKTGSDTGFEKGDVKGKSKAPSVDISVTATFMWKYNTSTCKFEFSSAMAALAVEGSVTFTYRFTACPIFYVYCTLGVNVEASLGLEVETTIDEEGNKNSEVSFGGFKIAPEFYIEAGVGVGIDIAKLEVYVKVSIAFALNFGKDGKVAVDEFKTSAAVGFRVVFLFFNYEMDCIGFETGYDRELMEEEADKGFKNGGWYFKWKAFGRDMGSSAIDTITEDGIDAADVSVSLPQDNSTKQQFYTTEDNSDTAMDSQAYDIADMPFQVSGYDSSAAAAKLVEGLDASSTYKLVTVADKNYVLFTIDRTTDAPIDKTMLVLSEIVTTSSNGKEVKGLANPADNKLATPYIVVDMTETGADTSGDLDFSAYVKEGKIYVTWMSYIDGAYDEAEALIGTPNAMTTEEILANVSNKTVIKTASFEPGTSRKEFTNAVVVSDNSVIEAGNKMLPGMVNDNVVFYAEAENYSNDELSEREAEYKEKALKDAEGNDGDGGTGSPYAEADYKYAMALDNLYGKYSKMNFAVKQTNGTYKTQMVDLEASMKTDWIANGTTIESMDFIDIDDSSFYIAFTTSEKKQNSEDTFTIKKLYVQKAEIVTELTDKKISLSSPVIIKTLMDAETKDELDGEYAQGTMVGETFDSPSFSNVCLLNGKLSPDGNKENFMIFTMNSLTYVVDNDNLELMTSGTQGKINLFFDKKEEGNSESYVTIGTDGDGNISAVYTDSVENTVNNALYLVKYDPFEGKWGKDIMLAMNHMDIYEASNAYGWESDYTKEAYFIADDSVVPGVHGGLDKFTFENPQIALGTPSEGDESGTLTIVTSGTFTELVQETLDMGDGKNLTEYVPKISDETGSMGGSLGLYALTYGIGDQQIGEESIKFVENNFVDGAKLSGQVSFRNTGDVSIRASESQPATISLMCGTQAGDNEVKLASWTVKSSIYAGQQVVTDMTDMMKLPENMEDRIFYFTVEEDSTYAGAGLTADAFFHSTRNNEDQTGVITVRSKAEVSIPTFTINAGDDMEIISANGVQSVVADVNLVLENNGSEDAENVKILVERTDGKDEEDKDKYIPINLDGSLISYNGQALTGTGSDGTFAITHSVQDGNVVSNSSLEVGESINLCGKIILPIDCFDGNFMNLKVTAISDAEEHESLNNIEYAQFEHVTKFSSVPEVLNLSVGNTVSFKINTLTASAYEENITATEMVVGADGSLSEVDNILSNRSYNPLTGLVTVRAGKEGSGVLRIADAATNSYVDIAFSATTNGININTENDYFTFDVPSLGTAFRDVSLGESVNGQIGPYKGDVCNGYDNSTFTFTTYAASIDLYFDGMIEVSSKNDFGYTTTNYSSSGNGGDSSYYPKTTIDFGNNNLKKHIVTVKILNNVTRFDKMIENYSSSSIEDLINSQKDTTKPVIILGKNKPLKAGNLKNGTAFEMPVYVYDNGSLASIDLAEQGGASFVSEGFAKGTLKITENKIYKIIALDSAGNLSRLEINVDWFDSNVKSDETRDEWPVVTGTLSDVNGNPVLTYINSDGYMKYNAQAADGIMSVELIKYNPATLVETSMEIDTYDGTETEISKSFDTKLPENGYYMIKVKSKLLHETYDIEKVTYLASGPKVNLFRTRGKTELFYSVGDIDNQVDVSRVVIYEGRVAQTDPTSIDVVGPKKLMDKSLTNEKWFVGNLAVSSSSTYTIMAIDAAGMIKTSVFDDKTSLKSIVIAPDENYDLEFNTAFSPYVFDYTITLPYDYPANTVPELIASKKVDSQTIESSLADDTMTYTVTEGDESTVYTVKFIRDVCTCAINMITYDEDKAVVYGDTLSFDVLKTAQATICSIAGHENHTTENIRYSYEVISGADFASVDSDGTVTLENISEGISTDTAVVRVTAYTDTASTYKDVTYTVRNVYSVGLFVDEGRSIECDDEIMLQSESEENNTADLNMNSGDTLKLKAVPKEGWEFTGWEDGNGNVIEDDEELSRIITDNQEIKAMFLDVTDPVVDIQLSNLANSEGVITIVDDSALFSNAGFHADISVTDGESGINNIK